MRLRLFNSFNLFLRFFGEVFARLLINRQGNFALTFALVSVPMLLGIGVSIDYVRAYNVKVKMQSDLDAALIAAVKKVDSLDETQIKAQVANWFTAQTADHQATYTLMLDTMVINKTKKSIQAVATGVVPTTFLGLANIRSVNVSVATSVAGPATQYLNVYIVFDKSASMLLAATTDGQTAMRTYAESSCVFACHTSEGNSKPYKGVTYSTNYALAKAMGIQLRADVSVTAAKKVLDLIDAADPTHSRIKVGFYSVGTDATQVLAPTASTTTAKQTLDNDSKGLNSATSQTTSDFQTSLPNLAGFVGIAGDGSTQAAPLKLVLLLTDGVQSTRDWVLYNPHNAWNCVSWSGSSCIKFKSSDFPQQTNTAPLNPAWCTNLKGTNLTMGVLYTEYLAIPLDWGYNGTVGDTMKTSSYVSKWKGAVNPDVNSTISRRDYIPYALKDCASEDMFLSAASPTEIETGLSKIFQQYLGSVRLTQ